MALITAKTMRRLVTTLGLVLLSGTATAVEWNMPVGVTEISRDNYNLHMMIFWICCVIGIGVFGVMFYSIFAHTKAKGHESATFHHSTSVEIAWTVIPFIILIAMAIPAAGVLVKMEDTSNSDLTVKVTGFQWGWHYEYLDNGVAFYSMLDAKSAEARILDSGIDPKTVPNYLRNVDNPLYLPVGKKVKILITSVDVIHSWWVPDLGTKKDANPGAVNSIWVRLDEEGEFAGKCTELCGKDHGFMPIVVKGVKEAEFNAWVETQKDKSKALELRTAAR